MTVAERLRRFQAGTEWLVAVQRRVSSFGYAQLINSKTPRLKVPLNQNSFRDTIIQHESKAQTMKPNSQVDACNTSNDVLCTTSLSDASRLVAWVSGASATVWGVLLFGLVGSGSNFNSSGISLFLFYVTVLHTGQAIASAISFKLGALFAALAFVFAAIVVIENFEFAALLTTPLICSACAIVIARRHGSSPHCESVR